MKKIFIITAILAGFAIFASAPADAATTTVVSDPSVKIIGVYNKAGGVTNFVDLSSSTMNAVRAQEPKPYPTGYVSEGTEVVNSVWDTGVNWSFQTNAPGSDWIWETERAEGPASYASTSPLYDPTASTNGRVVVFEKNFFIAGTPSTGTLHIAADNAWEVKINGVFLARSATAKVLGWELTSLEESFVGSSGWQTVGHVTVPASMLQPGMNTITILAGNEYYDNTSPYEFNNSSQPVLRLNPYQQMNPGALIFKLDAPYNELFCELQGSQFASTVLGYQQGLKKDGTPVTPARSVPTNGLVLEFGNNESNFFSLGFGGWLSAGFTDLIVNGPGNDIRITEDTWGAYPLEQANVFVSQDGVSWTLLGVANNTNSVNATHTTTELDLATIGWGWAKYVKVVDTSNPAIFPSAGDGYDLNAIQAIHGGTPGACEPELIVTKTATTSFYRTYSWQIDKSVNSSTLILSAGQVHSVDYEVELSAVSTDSGFKAQGIITIQNPTDQSIQITSVVDQIGATNGTVNCGTLPYDLPAEGSLICTYNIELPDASSVTNTVKVNDEFIGTAQVNFGNATITEIDKCVNVDDTYLGGPQNWSLCANDADKTYEYSRQVGPYVVEGQYVVENTATFVADDTAAEGSDSATVTITVPPSGCTLTQGYWKTHSEFGPAPYDDTWGLTSTASFYLSGQSWYDVLWTPPQKGNAYYQLAHQFIAAQLNMLNGASLPPSINTALLDAELLLKTYTQSYIGSLKANNPIRAQFTSLAGLLGSYNEGLVGPGHCSE